MISSTNATFMLKKLIRMITSGQSDLGMLQQLGLVSLPG